ncbi:hypothetical protein [Stenotrophomonas cyclobalanopsidis]|uniref:hypothetical protein n=1 Tax=Stenotrophomonas cyclobalanopsidis TaxID=2771362 RepID=UPI003460C06F
MATISSLATKYANYLVLNSENPGAAIEIANRINELRYTESGTPLTESAKNDLINKIEATLLPEKRSPDGLSIVLESEDSSQLIKLIQMIRSNTAGNHK